MDSEKEKKGEEKRMRKKREGRVIGSEGKEVIIKAEREGRTELNGESGKN